MRWKQRHNAALAAALALYSGSAEAFWRLPCRGQAGVARMDPLVSPGEAADHVHAIHGASNFGLKVDQDILRASQCTSCAVKQDKSIYWVPALYFIHKNGTAEMVEEVGGMLVYYLLYGQNPKAFPPNFRMIAGDTNLRNFTWPVPDPPKSEWTGAQASQFALQQKAIGFNCLNYDVAPEPSLYRHYLPEKSYMDAHCKDGVRFEIMFPSCWNGKDLDSPDHRSHVAYPSQVMDGECPEGFETRLVSLFYETIWNTYAFKDMEGEFVISNGDPTGYGYHADFITGWDPDFLQQAVDTCTNQSGEVEDCHIFDLQSEDDQKKCKFEVPDFLKNENCLLSPTGIPGDVPIQSGPAPATHHPAPQPTATSPAKPRSPSDSSLPGYQVPDVNDNAAAVTTGAGSAPNPTAAPVLTEFSTETEIAHEVVTMKKQVIVTVDCSGTPVGTATTEVAAIGTSAWTETITTVLPDPTEQAAAKRDQVPGHSHHKRRHNGKGGVDGWF